MRFQRVAERLRELADVAGVNRQRAIHVLRILVQLACQQQRLCAQRRIGGLVGDTLVLAGRAPRSPACWKALAICLVASFTSSWVGLSRRNSSSTWAAAFQSCKRISAAPASYWAPARIFEDGAASLMRRKWFAAVR